MLKRSAADWPIVRAYLVYTPRGPAVLAADPGAVNGDAPRVPGPWPWALCACCHWALSPATLLTGECPHCHTATPYTRAMVAPEIRAQYDALHALEAMV